MLAAVFGPTFTLMPPGPHWFGSGKSMRPKWMPAPFALTTPFTAARAAAHLVRPGVMLSIIELDLSRTMSMFGYSQVTAACAGADARRQTPTPRLTTRWARMGL